MFYVQSENSAPCCPQTTPSTVATAALAMPAAAAASLVAVAPEAQNFQMALPRGLAPATPEKP